MVHLTMHVHTMPSKHPSSLMETWKATQQSLLGIVCVDYFLLFSSSLINSLLDGLTI